MKNSSELKEFVEKYKSKGIKIAVMTNMGKSIASIKNPKVIDYKKFNVHETGYPMKDFIAITTLSKEDNIVVFDLDREIIKKFVLLKTPLILVYPKRDLKKSFLEDLKLKPNQNSTYVKLDKEWDSIYDELDKLLKVTTVLHCRVDPSETNLTDIINQF